MEALSVEFMVDAVHVSALGLGVVMCLSVVAVLLRGLARDRPHGRSWRGSIGVVVVPIPEHGVGAVRVAGPFGVTVLPARGIHYEAVARGERVLIVDLHGRVAEVCRYSEGE